MSCSTNAFVICSVQKKNKKRYHLAAYLFLWCFEHRFRLFYSHCADATRHFETFEHIPTSLIRPNLCIFSSSIAMSTKPAPKHASPTPLPLGRPIIARAPHNSPQNHKQISMTEPEVNKNHPEQSRFVANAIRNV